MGTEHVLLITNTAHFEEWELDIIWKYGPLQCSR